MEWIGRRPPELLRQALADLAQRLHCRGKGDRLAHRDNFRPEPLLARLRPKVLEVGGGWNAADDLDPSFFVGRDLRAIVRLERLEATGVDDRVAHLRERRRQSELGVAPGVAVAVIGEEKTDDLVGRN